ncbi:hypothetical protein AaE_014008, partial [Aphanomyces astaci]
FFNAIQALQHQKVTRCVDDLLAAVKDAFVDLDWKVLDKTFITLQKVMEEAFKFGGDNVYRLPHLKKDQAFKEARQVLRPNCDEDVCSALDAMDRRFEYEERVDALVDSLSNTLSVENSNIDEICGLVDAVNI